MDSSEEIIFQNFVYKSVTIERQIDYTGDMTK